MTIAAYSLISGDRPRSCAVFSSPHSGADYPQDFLQGSCLSPLQLRSSEDAFVDRFFADTLGAPVLKARYPRAYVDLNRDASEMDAAVVQGALPAAPNPRVAAGLGVVPRVVADGRAIQLGKMPMHEAQQRLDQAYHPYHTALAAQIDAQRGRFGGCHLFDFHSMPRSALASGLSLKRRPEIILGDRYGTSCDAWFGDAVARLFEREGFVVARNAPFAGGYITRHYGAPKSGVQAVQVEIDRSLYMDEKTVQPLPDFGRFAARMARVITGLAALMPLQKSMAAE